MLRLEGDKLFASAPAELWAKLTDLAFLIECIPDVAEVKEVRERTAALVLRPGFSFARGEMQLTVELVEASPPERAKLLMKTKGIGSSSEVEAAFQLAGADGGALLHWTADVKQLGGLLKAVPSGLIRAAAQRVLEQLLKNLEQKLLAE